MKLVLIRLTNPRPIQADLTVPLVWGKVKTKNYYQKTSIQYNNIY